MIKAEKIIGVDNQQWIKVTFRPNFVFNDIIKDIKGSIWVPHAKAWAIPYSRRAEFESRLGNYLIVWTDEEGDGNGGISEVMLSDKPDMPGYDVFYDKEGNITGSLGFKTDPWGAFQVKGFNCLLERDFLILADDAGLGKTWQVATAMEARKKRGDLKRGIVVCKASLLFNWRDEIHMHTHERAVIVAGTPRQRYQIYAELMNRTDWTFLIISYETFRMDASNLQVLDNKTQLDFCILDEAHKIKNPMAQLGLSIHLIPSFRFRYVLTATPLPNNPLESFNYLKFGRSMDLDWFNFQNEYAIYSGYGGKDIVGYKNIIKLKSLIQGNMLRRRKKDKLKDLPDVAFKTVPVIMTPLQAKMYKAVKEEIMEELTSTDLRKLPNALSKLLRLQQVTDSLDLIGAEPSSKNSAKLDTIDDMLEELIGEGNEKVIIFSRFRTMVELMEERLSKYKPAVIHGDIDSNGKTEKAALRKLMKEHDIDNMTEQQINDLLTLYMSSERQKEVYRFQKDPDCKVFIGCAPACREGLTLTAATHVIFIDCEWSPAYVEQAFSRAHRIGQKNAVLVYYLVCEGTIDERVQEILKSKEYMAQEMLDNGITAYNVMSVKELVSRMIA